MNCYASFSSFFAFLIVVYAFPSSSNPRTSNENYEEARKSFIRFEDSSYLGHDVPLSPDEQKFNEILMKHKDKEHYNGFLSPGNFTGARHFFHALQQIKESKVFKLIKKMPKGGVLHAHDTALSSTEKLMHFTTWSNLWVCESNTGLRFWFAKDKKSIKKVCDGAAGVEWEEVKKLRKKDTQAFDTKVKKSLTLFTDTPETEYRDSKEVWEKFLFKFFTIEGLVGFKKVWKEYFKQTLEEFFQDGVQYLEFRGLLPPVYELDGSFLSKREIVKAYTEVLQEFQASNPDFIGSKFIYAPLRLVNTSTISEYRATFLELREKFPKFIAGFDLVGPEDTTFPLWKFREELNKFPQDTNFFFHAGETNWNGLDVDENLIDAVLLGTKRIGHGYAILKHVKVLEEVKKRDIAIEVCPISNQVLKLVGDHRNHPASHLFVNDYPVVVSSDDPSLWNATPLSHDFYVAFMGIANANASLKFLKKLVMNSLKYSSLDQKETESAIKKWETKWNSYVKDVVTSGDAWFEKNN